MDNVISKAPASLIVAHSLAALPVAVQLKRRTGAPLLFDAHELETEREGWNLPVRIAARTVETALIGQADHVITVNDTICEWYRQHYRTLNCSVVRNVPRATDRLGASTLRQQLGISEDHLVVAYAGAFTGGRGLETALQAFRQLGSDRHIVFVGYGPLEPELRHAAQSMANVHCLSAVPSNQLITLLSGADIGIFQSNGKSLSYRFSLPNKVFEYAAAGLALILGPGPELERFISVSKLGWIIPADPASLVSLVSTLTRQNVRAIVAASSYAPPSWANEEPRLLEVYDRVLRLDHA